MTTQTNGPRQLAIWLFASAIFAFAASSFEPVTGTLRAGLVVAGFALIIAGCLQFGREVARRRRADDSRDE